MSRFQVLIIAASHISLCNNVCTRLQIPLNGGSCRIGRQLVPNLRRTACLCQLKFTAGNCLTCRSINVEDSNGIFCCSCKNNHIRRIISVCNPDILSLLIICESIRRVQLRDRILACRNMRDNKVPRLIRCTSRYHMVMIVFYLILSPLDCFVCGRVYPVNIKSPFCDIFHVDVLHTVHRRVNVADDWVTIQNVTLRHKNLSNAIPTSISGVECGFTISTGCCRPHIRIVSRCDILQFVRNITQRLPCNSICSFYCNRSCSSWRCHSRKQTKTHDSYKK